MLHNFSESYTLLSIKWNLIRLGNPAHGIVTKTVHKTLTGGVGYLGVGSKDPQSCFHIETI